MQSRINIIHGDITKIKVDTIDDYLSIESICKPFTKNKKSILK